MKLISLLLGSALVALVAGITSTAHAASFTIPLNTGTSGKNGVNSGEPDPAFTWNYTGNFADPRYQAYTLGDSITWIMAGGDLFSNNHYGLDVPAGTPNYRGVTFLYFTFDLPTGATNVKLNFDSIYANDRATLSLNQTELGSFTPYLGQSTTPIPGVMLGADSKYVSKSFISGNVPFSVDNQSLFHSGGQNVLRFWQNNTASTDPAAPARIDSADDGAYLSVYGALSYDPANATSVPESSSVLGLLAIGAIGAGSMLRRKQKVDQ